jgi:glycosyltransferase involved in cell wall biosynthesis
MCKVTIATITYNREHLLPRTINSVLAQTFTDFEYLIINNGSTDKTQSLLDKYCETDARIRLFSFPQNRIDVDFTKEKYKTICEKSIPTPPPPYFMIVDDDDFMEHSTVETLYNLITQYDADIATVGSRFVFPDGSKKNKFVFDGVFVYSRIEAMIEMLKREKFNASIGGKMLRKSVLNISFPPVEKIRDIHVSYRRMNNINRMVVSGEPLYYFYRHDNNMSGLDTVEQITPERMRQHLEANAMRTEWLSENMPEIKDFVFYSELSFMLSLYERIHRLKVESCFDIAQEMKGTLLQHNVFLLECGFCTQKEREILNLLIGN